MLATFVWVEIKMFVLFMSDECNMNIFLAAMISYNVIIGDTITKIVVRVGGGK